jgi:hypothetical protein
MSQYVFMVLGKIYTEPFGSESNGITIMDKLSKVKIYAILNYNTLVQPQNHDFKGEYYAETSKCIGEALLHDIWHIID